MWSCSLHMIYCCTSCEWKAHKSCAYGVMTLMSMNYLAVVSKWRAACSSLSLCCVISARRSFGGWCLHMCMFSASITFAMHYSEPSGGLKLIYNTVNHTPWQQPHVPLPPPFTYREVMLLTRHGVINNQKLLKRSQECNNAVFQLKKWQENK